MHIPWRWVLFTGWFIVPLAAFGILSDWNFWTILYVIGWVGVASAVAVEIDRRDNNRFT